MLNILRDNIINRIYGAQANLSVISKKANSNKIWAIQEDVVRMWFHHYSSSYIIAYLNCIYGGRMILGLFVKITFFFLIVRNKLLFSLSLFDTFLAVHRKETLLSMLISGIGRKPFLGWTCCPMRGAKKKMSSWHFSHWERWPWFLEDVLMLFSTLKWSLCWKLILALL